MIVAFMGNDGSGKSTNIRLLTRKLRKRNISLKIIPGFDHAVVHHLKSGIRRFSTRKMSALEHSYSAGNSEGKKTRLQSFLFEAWSYLLLLDCMIRYVGTSLRSDCDMVIFDRYFYDFAISLEHLGYSSRLTKHLFLRLPRPDLGFVFDTEPEIAYQRKKHDHTAAPTEYVIQRRRYIRLAKSKNFPIINTSHLPPSVTSDHILNRILCRL